MRFCGLAMSAGGVALALFASVPVVSKTVLTPGPKPSMIVPGRKPFFFASPPRILTSFGRDEPFLDGEFAYGYTGRVVTPIQRGGDVVAPAGSLAYGVPMRVRDAPRLPPFAIPDLIASAKAKDFGPTELVWCAATRREGSPKIGSVCLFNEGLTFGGYDSLMTSSGYILDQDPYGGGEIVPAPFDLGAPIHVRYYVQNLGKIARIKGQIWVGDQMANQWGEIFGDIGRGSQPEERLLSIGGGVVGIRPDPASKDHYLLRVVSPLEDNGSALMGEVRNDSRAKPSAP